MIYKKYLYITLTSMSIKDVKQSDNHTGSKKYDEPRP